MKEQILAQLKSPHIWADRLYWFDQTDSTNLQLKKLAAKNAPAGTVVIAGSQTQGRGRLGRSFHSPAGTGLYFSMLLRPECSPESIMHLTCAAAVAACNAVQQATGLRPDIKWINDLVVGKKKLGGILTELACNPDTGLVDYAIIGVGINCLQHPGDFPEDIRQIATSLLMETGAATPPAVLATALMEALLQISQELLTEKQAIMQQYKQNCITVGKQIRLLRGDESRTGQALDIDENGALWVCFDGTQPELVQSGEVSIRGMYGYL